MAFQQFREAAPRHIPVAPPPARATSSKSSQPVGRTNAIDDCCRQCRSRQSGPASSRPGGRAVRGPVGAGCPDTTRSPQPEHGRTGFWPLPAVPCACLSATCPKHEVPPESGWPVRSGRPSRKSTKRVLSGWSLSSYRSRRLPRTARTRLASSKRSNAMTRSSANRTRIHLPLKCGRTAVSNHSSST
jgi:hypothetical protein